MSNITFGLANEVEQYLQRVSLREPHVLKQLREETSQLVNAEMQISPEQGQFMALLMELMHAKKTLDIGTFTGYSALVVALALPADGKVITCDIESNYTLIAERFWKQAKVDHKIQLKIAPAIETLDQLLANHENESFDFAFIDADKGNYHAYYERSLALIKPNGLIAIDNTLWNGRVADPDDHEERTKAIRALNQAIHKDERVTISMIPIGDGLTLARKR